MDILYYSNKCKFCQKLLPYLVKAQISDKLNFICVDRRETDPQAGQEFIILENGKRTVLPPNIHRVPSLILVKKNYSSITGDEIYNYLQPLVKSDLVINNGEPVGFIFGGTSNNNVVSDTFTPYGSSLTTNLAGQSQNYFSVTASSHINTPQETYKPDKIGGDITIDSIQQQRNMDLQNYMPPMASQLNDVLAGLPTISQQMPPPGYTTMGVLPPSKTNQTSVPPGNPYSYSPINTSPKYTAEDAREILFGRGSGWAGGEDVEQTNQHGKTSIPAPYLNNGL